jgi:hypothetical protein
MEPGMSNAKFTPGPWRLKMETTDAPEHWPYAIIEGGVSTCDVETGFHLTGIMTEGTAHLIAAAPDLYEVVSRFEYFADAFIAREYEPGSQAVKELVAQAVAALRKARGLSAQEEECRIWGKEGSS